MALSGKFALCAAIGITAQAAESPFSITTNEADRSIRFEVDITRDSAAALLEKLDDRYQTLIVKSGGGDADGGLRIGDEVTRRGMTVVVDGYCASSCANFIFLGASNKRLLPGSILGFHGVAGVDAVSPENARSNQLIAQFNALQLRIRQFFTSRLIDPALIELSYALTKPSVISPTTTVYAKDGTSKTFTENQSSEEMDYLTQLETAHALEHFEFESNAISKDKIYFPSLATLKHFGVTGVSNYTYPTTQKELDAWSRRVFDFEATVVGDFE